jgi:hypothetical protein
MIRKERKARWVYRCATCDYTSPASTDHFGAQEWQQRHQRGAALTHAWQGLAAACQPAIDFVLSIIAEEQTQEDFALVPAAACTCTDYCSDDVSLIDCPHCKTLDMYDPCPVVGFGCGSVPDQDCDCCTPEQRKAAGL